MCPSRETMDRLKILLQELVPDRQTELLRLLQQKVYSVEDVSNILGVHPETVRRAIRNGRLQAFRVAGAKRGALKITQEELDRFMASGTCTKPPEDK